MMRTLIKCPNLPPETSPQERFEAHKTHIRQTLKDLKYEHLDRAWARRYYSWAGHLARLPPQRIARQALMTKNLNWWRQQQKNPEGQRHHRRRGNISRWENPLGRHHPKHELWFEVSQFRDRWKLFYPTFEKRLFGPHCPHDFSGVQEHNPDDPKNAPQEATPLYPQTRDPRTQRPACKKSPKKRSMDNPTPQGNGNPKRAKVTQHPKSAVTAKPSLTAHQMARNWERDLDRPLLSLLHPQDGRIGRGSSMGERRRHGHATASSSSRATTKLQTSHRCHSTLPAASQSSQEWGGESRRPGCPVGGAKARHAGHASRLGKTRSSEHDGETQAGPRRPSLPRRSTTSTSSSSSASTSDSFSDTAGTSWRQRTRQSTQGQRQEQGQEQSDKGQTAAKFIGQNSQHRPDAGSKRVLPEAAAGATTAAATDARQRQETTRTRLSDDRIRRRDDERRNERNEHDDERKRHEKRESKRSAGAMETRDDGQRQDDMDGRPGQAADDEGRMHDERTMATDVQAANDEGRMHDERIQQSDADGESTGHGDAAQVHGRPLVRRAALGHRELKRHDALS